MVMIAAYRMEAMTSRTGGVPNHTCALGRGKINYLAPTLLLDAGAAGALRNNLPGVLVERSCLGQGLKRLFELGIFLERDFVAFVHAKHGGERLFANHPLDPSEVLSDVGLGVLNVLLVEILREKLDHVVIRNKVFRDLRLGAQEIGGEAANAAREAKKYLPAH